MPKRRILFKVATLAAIVLGLVPASVLASMSTRAPGADAEMELAAQSGTGGAVTGAARIDGEGDAAITGRDLGAIEGQQYGLADGLQVLYTFREGSGTTVHDVSGVGVPLDLEMSDGSAVTWVPGGGLAIDSATLIASVGPATKVISACQGSNEITIDAWVRPANTTQDGPARIVTLSRDLYNRNFTLGQGLWGTLPSALYDVRLRTTATDNSGEPSLSTPDGSLTTELTHVVYTRDASGQARIYIDGVERASRTVGGDFSNWDGGLRLALANELTGGRPWLGEFHLVAIYSRALSPSIAIEKTADPTMIVAGDPVTYTYTVANQGDDPLSDVAVSDDRCSPVSDPTEISGNGDDVLDLGEVWGYTCTMTLDQDTTNIATVTATDPLSQTVGNSDAAFVDVIHPGIAIAKLPDTQVVVSGTEAVFTITVTNTGDVTLDNVTVTDVLASSCDADLGSLGVRDSDTYTCTAAGVEADFTNTATVTGGPPVGDDVSASDSADVTVVYPDISITKTVNWNGVAPDESQEFEICIAGPSYPGGDCQTAGYDGGILYWYDLAPGDYTVTETDPGSAWNVTITGSPATVSAGDVSVSASVTNAHKLGRLEVTKTVDWNGVPADANQTFEICITGPSYPGGDCRTVGSSGGTLSWGDLVPGDYTVAETDPGSAWDVVITGSPATVPDDGGTASAGVTNARKLGRLEVTKTVDWKGVTPDPNQTFTICIEGPSYPSGDGCQVVGYSGGTLSWDDLVPGVYTVTETSPDNLWRVTITGSPATVPDDGGSASAGVTNTRKLGSLEVVKEVNWNGVTPDESQEFEICIEGPSYPGGDCQTVGYTGGMLSWDALVPGVYIVTEITPGGPWDVTITGSPATVPEDGGSASASVFNLNGGGPIYLPLVLNSFTVAPDLVVEHIAVTSDSAQVVIKNQGNAPVSSNDPFWVDLYVDPDPVPTGVNQTWGHLCSQGIAWGVESPALPLEPGGTITLTIGDAYYWADYSNFPGSLPAGTPIYVQVDSADVQTTYGAVLENHEIVGGTYNNIAGPVFSTLVAAGEEPVQVEPSVLGDRPPASSRRLPPRP